VLARWNAGPGDLPRRTRRYGGGDRDDAADAASDLRLLSTAFIEVVVARAYRRRGVARQLLGRAIQDARGGCVKVQLLSHKRNDTDGAHRLYESAGFTPEPEGFRLYLRPWQVPSHGS
jgi:GNAT superfamily N-acetyltransferase